MDCERQSDARVESLDFEIGLLRFAFWPFRLHLWTLASILTPGQVKVWHKKKKKKPFPKYIKDYKNQRENNRPLNT